MEDVTSYIKGSDTHKKAAGNGITRLDMIMTKAASIRKMLDLKQPITIRVIEDDKVIETLRGNFDLVTQTIKEYNEYHILSVGSRTSENIFNIYLLKTVQTPFSQEQDPNAEL